MNVSIERLVRPFQLAPAAPAERAPAPASDDGDLNSAGNVEFSWTWKMAAPDMPSIEVTWPEDPLEEEEPEEEGELGETDRPQIVFEEVGRRTSTVRVENPDDPDQYVMVKRTEQVAFRGPDLRPLGPGEHRFSEALYVFNFRNEEDN